MDSETGQRLAEMIATAVVTKLTDKAIDELLEYLKQKEKLLKPSRQTKNKGV